MLGQSAILTVLGIGVVFFFLIVMIICMNILHAVLHALKLDEEKKEVIKLYYDDEGNLRRITIIPTNSCTNIKTYANLKYINKLYLKDQFLMIRDSDGKNPKYLLSINLLRMWRIH